MLTEHSTFGGLAEHAVEVRPGTAVLAREPGRGISAPGQRDLEVHLAISEERHIIPESQEHGACVTTVSYKGFPFVSSGKIAPQEIVTIATVPETIGDRIYAIRRALGPDARTELSLREFARRLHEVSGRKFYDIELSKMERGKRGYSIADLEAIAQLDPLNRGPWWIAWGVEVSGEVRGDELNAPIEIVEQGPVTAKKPAATPLPRRLGGKPR